MFNSPWMIDPSLNLMFEKSKFGCIFIIYGWKFTRSGCNLTRYGWNMIRCGCNLIIEHLFFYLLKIDSISGYWIMFSRWLGWPFGPPRSLSWKNRNPSIFKRRKSWKRLWILIYVSIYLLILQSVKQINKFTIGTSHSVGAGEGSKPRLSRSTWLNIMFCSNSIKN